jgi:hypothetical protein
MITKILAGIAVAPLLLGFGASSPTPLRTSRMEGYMPITMVPPANALAGSTITVTLTLAGNPTEDEDVAVSTTPNAFSSFPSYVTVPAGRDSVSFTVTLTAGYVGTASITGSALGGSATGTTHSKLRIIE